MTAINNLSGNLSCTAVILFCLFAFIHQDALGTQTRFETAAVDEGVTFAYEWLDVNSQPQQITFTLSQDALSVTPSQQTNYKPQIAQRYVVVSLLQEAKKIDARTAVVNVIPSNEGINIKVSSKDDALASRILSDLTSVQQEAYNTYLYNNYYTRFTTMFNQRAVKPDHRRYIDETAKALVPVSQAFYEKINTSADARAYFSLLLGWVQSIPYDTLEDRVASSGAGFAPPMGLLLQNKGDCDSKAVLTSALVRAFLPNTEMIMVFLPRHALLGVAITPIAGDETLEVEGKTFVLYDPTGPALLPFGHVSTSTKQFIDTGRYQVEAIN